MRGTNAIFARLFALGAALVGATACEVPAPQQALVDIEPDSGRPRFGFPVPDRAAIEQVIGVDHDPEEQGGGLESAICLDHAGNRFPACYDGHTGTDFTLRGGFDAMDRGAPDVVAAASGVVVAVQDGFFDRCRPRGLEIWCDGGPIEANFVVLEHEGGWQTGYWHLGRDSVRVAVGDTVACGQTLGSMASSGNSSLPHLHFEVWDPQGEVIDPYEGELSQDFSLWHDQAEPPELPAPGCAAAL